jgi:hypothetical protein
MKPTFKICPSAEHCGYLNSSIKGLNIFNFSKNAEVIYIKLKACARNRSPLSILTSTCGNRITGN